MNEKRSLTDYLKNVALLTGATVAIIFAWELCQKSGKKLETLFAISGGIFPVFIFVMRLKHYQRKR